MRRTASWPAAFRTRNPMKPPAAEKTGAPAHRTRELFPLFQIKERLKSWRWNLVESLAAEMADFVAAARAGRQPSCSGLDGLRALEMAHAVYRSSKARQAVLLPLAVG